MRLSEHPAFAHMDVQFVNHIQKVLDTSTSKNSMESVQKLLGIFQEIQQKNIEFTPEMRGILLNYFKNHLPKNQRSQFNAIYTMMQQLRNNQLPPQ